MFVAEGGVPGAGGSGCNDGFVDFLGPGHTAPLLQREMTPPSVAALRPPHQSRLAKTDRHLVAILLSPSSPQIDVTRMLVVLGARARGAATTLAVAAAAAAAADRVVAGAGARWPSLAPWGDAFGGGGSRGGSAAKRRKSWRSARGHVAGFWYAF